MKVFIKFDLPEDQEEYDTFNQANKYSAVLWDFSQYLRSQLKYNHKEWDNVTGIEAVEKIQCEFWEFIEKHGVEM